RHGDPPGMVRPEPVRHRYERPDGPTARARATGSAHRLRQRVVHRHHVHRAAGRGDHAGRWPYGGGPHHHRASVGHRNRAVHARPRGPVPRRVSRLDGPPWHPHWHPPWHPHWHPHWHRHT